MARDGLALHLHCLAQVLAPVLGPLSCHLHPGVDVTHDEAGVVPVLVGEDLGYLQPPTVVPDEEARLVDRLERDKTREKVIIPREPGALLLESLIVDVTLLHPDLAVPVPDVSPRPGDGLEGDRACPPQPGVDQLEHLGLCHEVALNTLVYSPVVAGPVLGGNTYYHFTWN